MKRKSRTGGTAPERLRQLQEQFAAHLRDPEAKAAPGDVDDRRMAIYRGLFFRNIRSFLSSNFPVLRKLYTDEGWDRLVRDFYRQHRARTPLFPEIAREFLQYLQDQRQGHPDDPPFILELAHYEWVELALSLDEQELSEVPADPAGDLLEGQPILSPLAWPLSYSYPVHRIGPGFRPTEPPSEATHLLVYRDRSDRVRFMQLSPVPALLIRFLEEADGSSGLQVLKRIARALEHPDPEAVVEGGKRLLEDLRSRDVVLGTVPARSTQDS